VLHAFGRKGEAPVPPLNLVGDFGGGGMLLAFGVACGLIEAAHSGRGQVIDAAMVEGASLLAAMFAGLLSAKSWSEERGTNILDTGAPWYNVYETKDGKYVSIGSIEGRFYEELLRKLGVPDLGQHDRSRWPEMKTLFEKVFRSKTCDEWCKVFEGSDACFAPVLSWSEARQDPHMVFRGNFIETAGVQQPAPAPRFSRTPGAVRRPPPERGGGGAAALGEWGFDAAEIANCHAGLSGWEAATTPGGQFSIFNPRRHMSRAAASSRRCSARSPIWRRTRSASTPPSAPRTR
jgi:alpha-methylacyl-CoA racemase